MLQPLPRMSKARSGSCVLTCCLSSCCQTALNTSKASANHTHSGNTREAETRTDKTPEDSPCKHAWRNHQDPYPLEQCSGISLHTHHLPWRTSFGTEPSLNQLLKLSPVIPIAEGTCILRKWNQGTGGSSITHYKHYPISSLFRESINFDILFITSSAFSTNTLIMAQHITGSYTISEKTQKVNFFSTSLWRNSVPFLIPERQLTHRKWETRYS